MLTIVQLFQRPVSILLLCICVHVPKHILWNLVSRLCYHPYFLVQKILSLFYCRFNSILARSDEKVKFVGDCYLFQICNISHLLMHKFNFLFTIVVSATLNHILPVFMGCLHFYKFCHTGAYIHMKIGTLVRIFL